MKIDLAVWTAVNGYEWQPGSVYSPKELAGYKDAIGPLEQYSLPLGGLFLKDGKAVFYRVQIAERMDSRGRGAIYLVLGTVPEERATEVNFAEIFNSPELSKPQKPFPTAIEYNAIQRECTTSLGREGFTERRFSGVKTFAELGGWCAEAKGGKLNVQITGTMESPLFTVGYFPYAAPAKMEPPQLKEQYFIRQTSGYDDHVALTTRAQDAVVRSHNQEEMPRRRGLDMTSFALGFILATLAFLTVIFCFGDLHAKGDPKRIEQPKTEEHGSHEARTRPPFPNATTNKAAR